MKKLNRTLIKRKSFAIVASSVITSLFYMHYLQAETLPQRGSIPFYIYDINSNGSISQDEFNTIRSLRMESRSARGQPMRNMASEPNFNQFDTDKDGQLNTDELAYGQQLQRQKRWKMRQGQGIGMSNDRNMPRFKDFDKNQDGLLTPEEFTSGMQYCQNMRQGMSMRKRQEQGRGMSRGRNMPNFEDFDINKDGYISEQELIEARSMRISSRIQQGYQMRNTANITPFQDIDTNSDGKISPDEFSAQQKYHQMGRQRPQ
ncbi:MAG: EF-hand domain-containing protein [gamma proteobacterium symbiont of Taylorina sp.]|nr:EF-hand domain-containing protein [gamma proteobacterium symbiont of Taylorina sp.]